MDQITSGLRKLLLAGIGAAAIAKEKGGEVLEQRAIGHVELVLQEPLPVAAFEQARVLGALILVDQASHKTAGAVLAH